MTDRNYDEMEQAILKGLKIEKVAPEKLSLEESSTFSGVAIHERGYGIFQDGSLHNEEGPALVNLLEEGAVFEFFVEGEHIQQGTDKANEIIQAMKASDKIYYGIDKDSL